MDTRGLETENAARGNLVRCTQDTEGSRGHSRGGWRHAGKLSTRVNIAFIIGTDVVILKMIKMGYIQRHKCFQIWLTHVHQTRTPGLQELGLLCPPRTEPRGAQGRLDSQLGQGVGSQLFRGRGSASRCWPWWQNPREADSTTCQPLDHKPGSSCPK